MVLVDEYVRTMNSIKHTFQNRIKIWNNYNSSELNLSKKQINLEKLKSQNLILKNDKIDSLTKEIKLVNFIILFIPWFIFKIIN